MSIYTEDWSGKSLGPYEILNEVGRGGMATVYRARQPSVNRVVAVKVLPHSFLHDPGFIERFRREVDVITRLEHPHIVPIYDYGEAEGVPYIAMRFLSGGSMAQRLRRGRPALPWLIEPLTQVSRALDYAHRQGVIHRDLKPGNILLDESDNAYLTDFGIARVVDSHLTGSAIVGTPAYMSPEQANGQPLNGRSDVYALGVVLFELIAGREPFEGLTPMALMLKHMREPLPSLRDLRPDATPELDAVIAKATAKAPEDRYATAGEFAAAYRAVAQSAPADDAGPVTLHSASTPRVATWPAANALTVSPSGPVENETRPEPAAPFETADQTRPDTPKAAKRRPPAMLIFGVLAVAIALIAAVWLAQIRNATNVPPHVPFAGAQMATTKHVRVDVPADWKAYDFSTDARQLNIWKTADGSASVSIAYDPVQAGDFTAAIQAYDASFGSTTGRDLIDEATSADGSIRRSYRVISGPTAPGQVDQFFLNRAPYLVVVETYSADSTGNQPVPTFQHILDSIQVN